MNLDELKTRARIIRTTICDIKRGHDAIIDGETINDIRLVLEAIAQLPGAEVGDA